ncbi:MAG: hypothetical protein RLZZ618_663 [Pseudomonadota bacterium]|jgi:hypothetical protein
MLWLTLALGTALVLLTALVLVMQGVVRGSESRRHVQADEARLDWQCQGQGARVISACQARGERGSATTSLLATAR